jgi:hypothetical protein
VDVDGFEASAVEGEGHFVLAVYALLPKDRYLRAIFRSLKGEV